MPRPSNNDFRIAGALGISPNPAEPAIEETMLQGLGYPLRPISGVPLKETEDLFDIVAAGQPMQWMGDWQAGKYYPKGAFVRSGTVTAVAVALTLEDPEPHPDPADPATYGIPTYVPSTQVNTSVVNSGQRYTFSQDGWIKELRAWTTEITPTTKYRIIIIDETDPGNFITQIIDSPVLTVDAWRTVSLLNTIIPAGSVLSISLEALNTGTDTNISGGWGYQGPTQTGPPALQSWTQDNQRSTFRIDKTDLDGDDRSSELEGVIPSSIITLVQTDNTGRSTTYQVSSALDQTTYMEYVVVLQSETGGGPLTGAVTTVDIDIPVPLPTEYAEEAGVWTIPPSWASSVVGVLRFDGTLQGTPATNGYGIDILFEPAVISTDWEIISLNG